METKRLYEFGLCRLDPAERRLLRDDQPVPLTPKCFDLLVILVENSGHLLEKEELMKQLWPDQFVEEANLSFNISSLRKALGEGQNGQRFIETVPKKGFRFVARVEERRDDGTNLITEARQETTERTVDGQHILPLHSTAARTAGRFPLGLKTLVGLISAIALVYFAYGLWTRRAETPVRKLSRTIAVLPFKPLSIESRDESLEMGMAETLITKLSSINQLVVRPMSVVRKYTDLQQDPIIAGRELQTEAVLDGSIQKAGDRVRVTVRLMNVESGASLWAAQFDENFTDIFKVQDSISERVTQALTLRLSPEESARLTKHYTDNPEAYQLYLQGHYLFSRQTGDRGDNLRRSLEYYQLAVEKDPKFALAYVGVAEFYLSEGNPKLSPWERLAKAKAAVAKALELDNALAEAHTALAELKYQYEFDRSGAEAEFKRALDLNPNNAYIHLAYSWYLMCGGLFDQAQAELDKAQELEPGSLRLNKTQGILFLFMRQYDKAISHYQTMREVEPNLIHRNQWSMSVAYEQMGIHAEAVEEFLEDGRIRRYLKPEEIETLRKAFRVSGWQSFSRTRIDLLEEKSKKEYIPPTVLAGLYALSGEKDLAFAWLEKAVDTRDGWIALIKIQPAYDSLRSDPRFTNLLQRMNLTP
jgi:DNA-binding winged helix-turn-helix (wHTH) protein/TolB-like protein/Tfp pilus assembly protein PilF